MNSTLTGPKETSEPVSKINHAMKWPHLGLHHYESRKEKVIIELISEATVPGERLCPEWISRNENGLK